MTPTADLVLAPVPKQVELTTGAFQPPRPLLDALRRYDGSHGPVPGVQIIVGRSVSENGSENGLTRDSYSLEVQPSGVTITAPAPQGAFYGMMTLRQIVRQSRADHVPCLRIRDWPDYPNRGIMLDISRDRVPTMDTIYRLIDLWSELKINQLQLYTEHTFAYARHPKVWQGASPMTAEEIRLIDGYCRDRFIELVPNQNSFGHMERWLKHPEYLHLAEAPDGFNGWNGLFQREPFSLSPSVPESVPFLAGLYDELLPNFSSTKFNVGCDETIDLGQGRSSRMCREHGTGRVYVDFVNRVYRLVHERGKRMLYWGDVILHYPELITELPKEAIALTWGYEADHPFESDCAAFQTAGVPFYVCAGTSAWNSLGGRWQNARGNLERA
ncbi:beta-N-acetylhexosaminidase, partial [Salinispira pacifica]